MAKPEAHAPEESMLRLVVESAPSALIMVDAAGSITLVNTQVTSLFGYLREELLGQPIDMLVPERYRVRHPGQRQGFFATPSKRPMGAGRDLFGRRKDGSEVPVEIGLTPIAMPTGPCVLAAIIDISERRRLERERREIEQRYVDLVEQSISGFVVRRPEGQLVLVNDAYCRMTGYTREELLTLKAKDMVVDQTVLEIVAQLKPGESTRIETLMKCKGGRLREVEYVTQRLADGNLQSVLLDLSERKRAERERDENRQRYEELVEQAADGIMVRQPGGRIVFVNGAACRMLGYSRQELLGMEMAKVVDRESLEQVRDLRPGEMRFFERRLRHKQGYWVPVETSAYRLMNGDFQNIFHDISERLRTAEALRTLPKQLLDAQEAERRRIARELHDEIGQALTATQIRLRDLEAQSQGAPAAKQAGEIAAMVGALLQQVRRMSLDLRPAVLDDLGLAAAIRWFMREHVPEGHVRVELEVPLTLPRPSVAVEAAMFRAFQSAITNVLRHAEASCVQVSLRFAVPRLTLEVHDDGKGFDLAAARQRARQGGSLGLLGMEEWISLSGGTISIESQPGHGTTVRAVVLVEQDQDAEHPV